MLIFVCFCRRHVEEGDVEIANRIRKRLDLDGELGQGLVTRIQVIRGPFRHEEWRTGYDWLVSQCGETPV